MQQVVGEDGALDGVARGDGDDRHHDHHPRGEGGPGGRGPGPRGPPGVVLPVEGADGGRVGPEEQDTRRRENDLQRGVRQEPQAPDGLGLGLVAEDGGDAEDGGVPHLPEDRGAEQQREPVAREDPLRREVRGGGRGRGGGIVRCPAGGGSVSRARGRGGGGRAGVPGPAVGPATALEWGLHCTHPIRSVRAPSSPATRHREAPCRCWCVVTKALTLTLGDMAAGPLCTAEAPRVPPPFR